MFSEKLLWDEITLQNPFICPFVDFCKKSRLFERCYSYRETTLKQASSLTACPLIYSFNQQVVTSTSLKSDSQDAKIE